MKSFTKDQLIPNKVVEWLRFESLALLAVPRKSDGDEADKYKQPAAYVVQPAELVSDHSKGEGYLVQLRGLPVRQ